MDLRHVRKQFLGKDTKYACSYDPDFVLDLRAAVLQPRGLLVRTSRPDAAAFGVFHVLDALSVAGVDDRMHDCPLGTIQFIEEAVLFRNEEAIADIEGRLGLETRDGAAVLARYRGILRFDTMTTDVLQTKQPLRGNVWLAPLFETADTRYRWLSEHACSAFGTWEVDAPKYDWKYDLQGEQKDDWLQPRRVRAKIDVYSNA